MRPARSLLLSVLALVALAPGARAAGVSLRWSACGDYGVQNKLFACNTNTGSQFLVGSFTLAADLADVSGNEMKIDFASASPTLPAWWQFENAGACRQTSLAINFVLSPPVTYCIDWAQGLAVGGIGAYNVGFRGPNTARLVAASAVAAEGRQYLYAGQEYFSFNLVIDRQNTVGTDACAGCATPVCIVFDSIDVTTPVPANNVTLTGDGADYDRAFWQGGWCLPVPTRKGSWGAVKALYR